MIGIVLLLLFAWVTMSVAWAVLKFSVWLLVVGLLLTLLAGAMIYFAARRG